MSIISEWKGSNALAAFSKQMGISQWLVEIIFQFISVKDAMSLFMTYRSLREVFYETKETFPFWAKANGVTQDFVKFACIHNITQSSELLLSDFLLFRKKVINVFMGKDMYNINGRVAQDLNSLSFLFGHVGTNSYKKIRKAIPCKIVESQSEDHYQKIVGRDYNKMLIKYLRVIMLIIFTKSPFHITNLRYEFYLMNDKQPLRTAEIKKRLIDFVENPPQAVIDKCINILKDNMRFRDMTSFNINFEGDKNNKINEFKETLHKYIIENIGNDKFRDIVIEQIDNNITYLPVLAKFFTDATKTENGMSTLDTTKDLFLLFKRNIKCCVCERVIYRTAYKPNTEVCSKECRESKALRVEL